VLFHRQLILLILLTSVSSFASAGWVPNLESSSGQSWSSPADSYRINIDASVPDSRLQNFSLEVDNIDVTPTVELIDNSAVFKPPQPLASGLHSFRLVEYTEDGSILELGYWEIEIRSSSLYREADANIQANLSVYGINDDLPEEQSQNGVVGDGSAIVEGIISDEAWAIAANAQFLFNSEAFEPTSSKKLELGEYIVSGEAGVFRADLGNQSVGPESLVMQNFRRRGLSALVDLASVNSRITGFALSSQEAAGINGATGLDDSDNLIHGLLIETQPFTENPEHLYLAVEYIAGKGSTAGISTGDAAQASEGDTVGIIADSSLFSNQLRIRAEYADATTDFDGSGALPETSDNAHHLLINYSPNQLAVASINLNLGIENKKVGTFYNSLANPGLPSDKELIRTYVNTTWKEVSLDLSYANEEDNVSDLNTIPTIKSDVTDIGLSYSPNWDISLLGRSSYSVIYSRVRSREIDRGTAVAADPTNNMAAAITLTANFSYTLWEWQAIYGSGNNEDFTDVQIDTELNFAELVFSFPIGSRVSLTPSARREITKQTDDLFVETENTLFNLGLNAMIIQDALNASLNASLNQEETSNDSTDIDNTSVTLQAVWNAVLPRGNIPAMDVVLSANYNEKEDKVDPTQDIKFYQVFLGLTVAYQ